MKKLIVSVLVGIVLLFAVVSAWADVVRHEVQSGETLYSIARRYQVPPAELQRANSIEVPNMLLPGTVLTIPSVYRVERGDTLFSIARRFNVTVDQLRELNELEGSLIAVGRTLRLPSHTVVTTPESTPSGAVATEKPSESGENEPTVPNDNRLSSARPVATPASQETPAPLPVAATIETPIAFAQGGLWPVIGQAEAMDGKLPGVLIRGLRGSPVHAVTSGRVVYAGPHTTFGRVVFIQSPQGYIYVYGGHDALHVRVGDTVDAGTTIGTLGLSPAEQAAALYFTVWRDNQFVDPAIAPRG